jgi:hypothetical protein
MDIQLTHAARIQLAQSLRRRYQAASSRAKKQILNEFIAVSGYHPKYAIHLLNARDAAAPAPRGRARPTIYDDAAKQALIVLWEASDRVCGKRLKPLLRILLPALERHGQGAQVTKRYHPPETPCERLLSAETVSDDTKVKLREVGSALDPLQLLEEVRAMQSHMVVLADGGKPHVSGADQPRSLRVPGKPLERLAVRRSASDALRGGETSLPAAHPDSCSPRRRRSTTDRSAASDESCKHGSTADRHRRSAIRAQVGSRG